MSKLTLAAKKLRYVSKLRKLNKLGPKLLLALLTRHKCGNKRCPRSEFIESFAPAAGRIKKHAVL